MSKEALAGLSNVEAPLLHSDSDEQQEIATKTKTQTKPNSVRERMRSGDLGPARVYEREPIGNARGSRRQSARRTRGAAAGRGPAPPPLAGLSALSFNELRVPSVGVPVTAELKKATNDSDVR
ncbi:hypothetical protein EVAR_8129_1 [Eumeta japonica]|uniref:Uncharacterized protein n=1 Tax=Eumeta variegata TaxID=151549 RepID=A0A4C1TSV4_EUMVA|nr:hypothetical protein EVAR_8129_1 [Eumeta japonica]